MTNNLITRIGVQVDDVYRRLYSLEDKIDKIQDPVNTEKVNFYDSDVTSQTSGTVSIVYDYVADGSTSLTHITKTFNKSTYQKLVDYILYSNEVVLFVFQKNIVMLRIDETSTVKWYSMNNSPVIGTNKTTKNVIIGQTGFDNSTTLGFTYLKDTTLKFTAETIDTAESSIDKKWIDITESVTN